MPMFETSKRKMAAAARVIPGGASSNFRIGMQPTPLVIERGEGPYLIDADGNRLIDYYLALGPMILGHSPPAVIEAARRQLDRGILYAAQTDVELEAAELFCSIVPCAERVRFTGSGSESVQAALRLARAGTGRSVIVRFEGHYHGWPDNILWSAAPPLDRAGPAERPSKVMGSAGQDPRAGDAVEVLGWNDLEAVRTRLAQGDVAAVIMEPAMCNSSAIAPRPGYLEGVREACTRAGTVLIFDEVITGFRLAAGGAQQLFGVTPDLAVFGKALANGFPVAAVAGRADLMDLFVTGGVMHGGTYNAHPVGMAATVATLNELKLGEVYRRIERSGRRLMDGLTRLLADRQIAARCQGFPGIFHLSLGSTAPIETYRDMLARDRAAYVRFAGAMVEGGVRTLERGAWFLSAVHDDAVIDRTLEIAEAALARL